MSDKDDRKFIPYGVVSKEPSKEGKFSPVGVTTNKMPFGEYKGQPDEPLQEGDTAFFEDLAQRVGDYAYEQTGSPLAGAVGVAVPAALGMVSPTGNKLSKGETGILNIKDILTSKKSFEGASKNIKAGNRSKTTGALEVWKTEEGRYLLVDGQHRFAEAVARGDKTVPVEVIGEGYSDYWAIPKKTEEYLSE